MFLFYKMWQSHKRLNGFLLNYTAFVYTTTHIKPSKHDSTSGTKSQYLLKTVGGYEAVD